MHTEALTELAEIVLAVERPHPVRVAIDGCSAAGKTTLADELADVVQARTDREIVRVGIDYFKRAPELRTAYPIESPESYYLGTWDHDAIRERLLLPLGPGGDRRYTAAIRDPGARALSETPVRTTAPDAVLVADGGFLQVPALDDCWDLRIYVYVSFDTVLRRGTARDQAWMDSAAAAEERYRNRYIPGERMYVDQIQPRSRAQIVVDNEDPANPMLTVN
ncbi:uridine kinase [Kribbella sp. NPDC049227]|uniref:uridine kinase n=1 Tax=Kribbella sp. NPDC049227 TaxID=3364113 RepID=UPI003713EEE2